MADTLRSRVKKFMGGEWEQLADEVRVRPEAGGTSSTNLGCYAEAGSVSPNRPG